jgi:hypothetical protein
VGSADRALGQEQDLVVASDSPLQAQLLTQDLVVAVVDVKLLAVTQVLAVQLEAI